MRRRERERRASALAEREIPPMLHAPTQKGHGMMLRSFLFVFALALSACGQGAPHPYPAEAKTRFDASCPPESAVCTCTWEAITRTVPYDEYQAALERFRETGNMEPRITRARTTCIEHHPEG